MAERRHPARRECVCHLLRFSARPLQVCPHCPLSGVILYDQLSIWRSLRLKINMAKAAISTDCYSYCYGYWYWILVLDGFGIGIGIRIAAAQCNFVVLATKTGRKKEQERRERGSKRGEERQRNQAKRRAVSAIDMLDRQRTTWDDEGQTNLQSGFRYALSGIRNRIRLRIRLSKPIVGPCKCQACVSFHMPAASYPLPPSLSLAHYLSFFLSLFQSVLCDMNYTSFLTEFFLWTFSSLLLCCVCGACTCMCVCGVYVWCVCGVCVSASVCGCVVII